ncbi:hypothetical protein [Dictyobacter kobayashii]|uniref:Uncharacterized protein n=1 Tax=Dictyobacter kobayashii TaxID=2014872 RepID=A0A402APW6_9CHLR|nr:hypothetical protein [Dictyobacter kobayashii]GCE21221.1 hypothetical protein KDK_50210 [Dictyobacter kobayashii]
MQPARTLNIIKSFAQKQQGYRFSISMDNGKTLVDTPFYAIVILLGVVLFVIGTLIKLLLESVIN